MIYLEFIRNIYRQLRPTVIKGNNNAVSIKSKRHGFYVRIYGDNNSSDIGENSRLKYT